VGEIGTEMHQILISERMRLDNTLLVLQSHMQMPFSSTFLLVLNGRSGSRIMASRSSMIPLIPRSVLNVSCGHSGHSLGCAASGCMPRQ
jgi:hypothetical protein